MKALVLIKFILLLVWLTIPSLAQDYSSPEKTFETYLEACKVGSFEKAEACYTKSSRALAKQRSQGRVRHSDSLVDAFDKLSPLTFRLESVNTKRAILWPSDESVPPFFLRIQEPEENWRLDYHFMSNFIQVEKDGWKWRNKRIFKIWKSRE